MTNAISVSGLVKNFGNVRALDGLDLEVAPGEVHGFLGPNGAGKTTTIRVLLGLIRHDAGTATLLGGDPWTDATELHRRLAYVPGDVTLWPKLTGGEVIDLLGRLRGGLDESRKAMLLERFDLDPTKKGRTYSKGNRQKVALVAALASDVELLILDEPTAGLDPLMEEQFRKCIEEDRATGRTVLLRRYLAIRDESGAQTTIASQRADRFITVRRQRIADGHGRQRDVARVRHHDREARSATCSNGLRIRGLLDVDRGRLGSGGR